MGKKNGQKKGKPVAVRPKRSAKPARPRPNAQDVGLRVQIGKATAALVAATADPETADPTGLTDFPANSSRKLRSFAKGSITLPASGFQFVVADPHYGCFGGPAVAVFTGHAAFTLATISLTSTGTPITGLGNSTNSDYPVGAVGPGPGLAEFRPVVAKLKLRYSGTNLNRGGTVVGFQDPRHQSLEGRTFSSIESELLAERFTEREMGKWMKITWRQLDITDTQFQEVLPVYTPAAGDPTFYMGFVIQGPANTPMTFDWEFWVHPEFQGQNIRGQTKTIYDPVGWGAYHSVAMTDHRLLKAHQMTGQEEKEMMMTAVAKHMAHDSSHVSRASQSPGHAVQDVANVAATGANLWTIVSGIWDFFFAG